MAAERRTALLSIMLLDTVVFGGNLWPSRCSCLYTCPMYIKSGRPSVAVAQDWMSSSIFDFTSEWIVKTAGSRSETMLSINSREAISFRKWSPPFFTQVSVSYMSG